MQTLCKLHAHQTPSERGSERVFLTIWLIVLDNMANCAPQYGLLSSTIWLIVEHKMASSQPLNIHKVAKHLHKGILKAPNHCINMQFIA